MRKIQLLLLSCLLLVTACAKAPKQTVQWASRNEWNQYVDELQRSMQFPEAWAGQIKTKSAAVSGYYINHMVPYLDLEGDPIRALVKRYAIELVKNPPSSMDDISPAIDAAVNDLITAGDKKNVVKNDGWLQTENAKAAVNGDDNGVWDAPTTMAKERGDFVRDTQAGGNRRGGVLAPGTSENAQSDVDTGKQ